MKEIQKTVTTLKTFYVATDGKEFDTKSECQEWEDSCFKKAFAHIEQMPHVIASTNGLHMWNGDDNEEVMVIIPVSEDDIDAIRCVENCFTETDLTYDSIGKPLALRLGFGHTFYELYDLEDHLQDTIRDITHAINTIQLVCKERRYGSNGQ